MALEDGVLSPKSYGWINVQRLSAALSLQNVDNFA